MKKVHLLNSAVMPQEGFYTLKKVSPEEFKNKLIPLQHQIISYIGYVETARILSDLLGINIPVSRKPTHLEDKDLLFIARLKYRLEDPKLKGEYVPKPEDFEFFIGMYSSIASLYDENKPGLLPGESALTRDPFEAYSQWEDHC